MFIKIKNYIVNLALNIIKRFGFGYFMSVSIVLTVLLSLSIGLSFFLYEPLQTEVLKLNNQFFIFIILFLPTASVMIGIMTLIKFSIDVFNPKIEAARLRFTIVIIMTLTAIIPSLILTYISIFIIKSNLNISLNESTDRALITLIEYSKEKIEVKKKDMERVLRNVDSRYFISVVNEYERGVYKEEEKKNILKNLTIISNDSNKNIIIFKSGIDTPVDIDRASKNETNIFLNNEFNNYFYVTAIVPYRVKGREEYTTNYALWSEAMPANFILQRNDAINAFRLYRSTGIFINEFSTVLYVLYVLILGISAFLAIILGIVLSRLITTPLGVILAASKEITNANFNISLKPRGISDMRNIINNFNTMASSLLYHKNQEERRARLETWREAAIKVAHEIKNPLTPIILITESIARNIKEDMTKDDVVKLKQQTDIILKNVDIISSLIKSFSEFSFYIKLSDERQSVNICIMEAINYFSFHKDIEIKYSFTSNDLYIRMDRDKLLMAFINMIKNAFEAIDHKGSGFIYISTYHQIYYSKECFVISIQDTGVGIAESNLDRIFEPYFTSKSKGTGIGLALVEKTLNEHNGKIVVESQEKEGTVFFIYFPLNS